MKTYFADVVLRGKTPLLMHKATVAPEAIRLLPQKGGRSQVKGSEHPSPQMDAALRAYLSTDMSRLIIPASMLLASLRDAAHRGGWWWPLKGRSKGYYWQVLPAALEILPDEILLEGPNYTAAPYTWEQLAVTLSPEALPFVIDTRPAVVEGKMIPRSRARIDVWSMQCLYMWREGDFPVAAPEELREITSYAGWYMGLMDQRPSSKHKPGKFGRFDVVSFVVRSEDS
jgi:hypothetical protein